MMKNNKLIESVKKSFLKAKEFIKKHSKVIKIIALLVTFVIVIIVPRFCNRDKMTASAATYSYQSYAVLTCPVVYMSSTTDSYNSPNMPMFYDCYFYLSVGRSDNPDYADINIFMQTNYGISAGKDIPSGSGLIYQYGTIQPPLMSEFKLFDTSNKSMVSYQEVHWVKPADYTSCRPKYYSFYAQLTGSSSVKDVTLHLVFYNTDDVDDESVCSIRLVFRRTSSCTSDYKYPYIIQNTSKAASERRPLSVLRTDIQDDVYQQGYNIGFNQGSSAGYKDGYNAGKDVGYSNGLTAGKTLGYNDGYTDGSNIATDNAYQEGYNKGTSEKFANITPWQAIVTGVNSMLGLELFNGVKLSTILSIGFGLILLGFVIKIFLGG